MRGPAVPRDGKALTGKVAFLGETASETIAKPRKESPTGPVYPSARLRLSSISCAAVSRKTRADDYAT